MVNFMYFTTILKGNLNDLQIAARDYDIIFSLSLVSYRQNTSEILFHDFNKPTLLLKSTGRKGLAMYIRTGFSASLRNELTFN